MDGVEVGVCVGVNVRLGVGVGVGVRVRLGVGEDVRVAVCVGVGVGVKTSGLKISARYVWLTIIPGFSSRALLSVTCRRKGWPGAAPAAGFTAKE